MELSQILVAAWISSFQEEHILEAAKNLSTSPKILEESRSYELQNDFPWKNAKEAEKLWTTSNGEHDEGEHRNYCWWTSRLHWNLVSRGHHATILFSSSTPSDAKTSRLVGSSYPGNHCGNFFTCGYEYVSYLASHMVTLENFLHLNKDFPFFLGRVG